ncbi:MAG: DegT/DnrJ/EryC1/StrS family aminotransferase [Kiritimatiellae bacterium]|nr:DegT/DnrJ/EryC1/StrS family aminotransferase [Kiritimatiellia bacterium]
MTNAIHVTSPSLPPLAEFIPYLEKIWASRWLTNNGQFHQQFEAALADYLGVKYVSVFTNGMIALQAGMQALRITGEVITTPFTFVATTHAIHLNGCTPVFCDIEPESFTLDPEKVESLITPRTTAILPVHVYGNPCRHERLKRVADTYGLKLFYDAAHVFGVRQDGQPVASWGDLSMLSFHATKVFNTLEGGALVTDDPALKRRIDFLRNFGFQDEVTVVAPGTNGKVDEVRSAYGLLQLKYVDAEIAKRRRVADHYRAHLQGVPGLRLMDDQPGVKHNYGYFPVLVDAQVYGMTRDALYEKLKANGIFSRRYFYPLCSQFPTYRTLPSALPGRLPVAERVAEQILCLPIYADLGDCALGQIVDAVRAGKRNCI